MTRADVDSGTYRRPQAGEAIDRTLTRVWDLCSGNLTEALRGVYLARRYDNNEWRGKEGW